MTYIVHHAGAFGLIILGLVWFVWAQPAHAVQDKGRRDRLAALDRGAKETFFEEREELETYQSRRPAWYRWIAGLAVLGGVIALLF